MLVYSVQFCLIFSLFFHSSHLHKTPQTLFDHPLTSNSFNLFTEIQDPNIKLYSPPNIPNPRFNKLVFLSSNNDKINNNYYNILDNDDQVLYVMGEDFLYKFDASDISKAEMSESLSTHPAFHHTKNISLTYCRKFLVPLNRGPTPEYVCLNHLQSLYPISSSQLLVCSTGMGRAQLYTLDINKLKISKVLNDTTSRLSSGYGICSGIPYTLSTTIIIPSSLSSSSYNLFGGSTQNGFISSTISRSDLDLDSFKVSNYESAGVYEAIEDASYIASFQIGQYVYIFSHERGDLKDPLKGEDSHYTVVTRMCKSRIYPVLKVKLKCKRDGLPYSFYFSKLKHVVYEEKKGLLHALFTTEDEVGSAICLYKVNDIDTTLVKAYTLVVTDTSGPDNINICLNTERLSFDFDQCTSNTNGKKMTYTTEEGITSAIMSHPFAFNDSQRFSIMTVERLDLEDCVGQFHASVDLGCYVYWMYDASRPGYLYRFFNKILYEKEETVSINNVRIFKEPEQISNVWDLQYKRVNNQSYVYVVTDRHVVQLNTKLCSSQYRCTSCATDPHCMWDSEAAVCVPRDYGMMEDAGERYVLRKYGQSAIKLCQPHCNVTHKIQRTSNSSLHLLCHSKCHPESHPLWFIDHHPIDYYNVDEFDDVIAAKKLNTPFNLNNLPNTNNYGDEYNKKLSQTVQHNPYFDGGTAAPKDILAVADPRDFGLHVLNLKHLNHSGVYECRDQRSGVVLVAYKVLVNKYCNYGTDLESTWKKEYENWCVLYEEQVHMHSCYKKCSGEKGCYKGCLQG